MSETTATVETSEPAARSSRAPDHLTDPLVQRKGNGSIATDSPSKVAAAGAGDAGGPVPYFDSIQSSFGSHDISGVRSHEGPAAAAASETLGAKAYAFGDDVAFGSTPSLHTAAHEAAHVVQQRSGVSLKGGVGAAGDVYERHADAVADTVVRGESAQGLLDSPPGGGGGGGVQLDRDENLAALGLRGVEGQADVEDEDLLEGEGESPAIKGTPRSLRDIALTQAATVSKFPKAGGPEARPILKALGENWFFAKDVLVSGKWPKAIQDSMPPAAKDPRSPYKLCFNDVATREQLMWRLVGMRDWETYGILRRMLADYKTTPEAKTPAGAQLPDDKVLKFGAPGSVSLTSDIDINLKGVFTHQAVKRFNTEFRARGWAHEPGTVYDVNVYALDNLHGLSIDGDKVMHVAQEKNVPEGFDANVADVKNQEVATLVKMLRFMCHGEECAGNPRWEAYKSGLGCGEGQEDGNEDLDENLALAEERYEVWRTALEDERQKILDEGAAEVDTLKGITSKKDAADKQEASLDIQASNRLYEKKALELEALRNELKQLAEAGDADKQMKVAVQLRQAILEAGMFANEAMISRGASNLVVFGTQEGVKEGVSAIELTEAQYYHAFNEQLADTVKEFGHYAGDLGAGLLKGGKYLMRMALAMDQLGIDLPANAEALRQLGTYSIVAKAMEDKSSGQKTAALAKLMKSTLGFEVADTDGFIDRVIIPFGAEVSKRYKDKNGEGSSALKKSAVAPEGQDVAQDILLGLMR